jgi:hypothetical protein
MGQLGDGEHEDQVKEEFHKRRSAEFMVPSDTEEGVMAAEHGGILWVRSALRETMNACGMHILDGPLSTYAR